MMRIARLVRNGALGTARGSAAGGRPAAAWRRGERCCAGPAAPRRWLGAEPLLAVAEVGAGADEAARELPPPRFTSSEERIATLPPYLFKGNMVVVTQAAAVREALNPFRGETLLGFDTESYPNTKLQCIQLASARHAVVIRRSALRGGVPAPLKALLEDRNVVKVGQQPHREAIDFFDLFGVRIRRLADVSHVARLLDTRPLKLRSLVATFLDAHLSKAEQRSNWSLPKLTPGQVHYACADAHATRQVFLRALELYEGLAMAGLPGGFHNALAHSRSTIGDFESEILDTSLLPAGCDGVPNDFEFFQDVRVMTPRHVLAQVCSSAGVTQPEFHMHETRPDGFRVRCVVPGVDVEPAVNIHPMLYSFGASQLAALRMVHRLVPLLGPRAKLPSAGLVAPAHEVVKAVMARHGLHAPPADSVKTERTGDKHVAKVPLVVPPVMAEALRGNEDARSFVRSGDLGVASRNWEATRAAGIGGTAAEPFVVEGPAEGSVKDARNSALQRVTELVLATMEGPNSRPPAKRFAWLDPRELL